MTGTTGPELDPAQHWERAAPDWIAWTRTPGHDAFWSYRDAFRGFVPAPGAATLEVGPDPTDSRLAGRWDRVPMFCWFTALALPSGAGTDG